MDYSQLFLALCDGRKKHLSVSTELRAPVFNTRHKTGDYWSVSFCNAVSNTLTATRYPPSRVRGWRSTRGYRNIEERWLFFNWFVNLGGAGDLLTYIAVLRPSSASVTLRQSSRSMMLVPLQRFLSRARSVISARSLLECSVIGCWISARSLLNTLVYRQGADGMGEREQEVAERAGGRGTLLLEGNPYI